MKRSRNINFSRKEEELLVELVITHKNIIENKKTGSLMWKEKKPCWAKLSSEFNSQSVLVPHTVGQLQLKYKNIKNVVQKKSFDKVSVIYISFPMIHTFFIIELILIIFFCLNQDWNIWRQAVEEMILWLSMKSKKKWRTLCNSLLKACLHILTVTLKLMPCLQFMTFPMKYMVRQCLTYPVFASSLKYTYNNVPILIFQTSLQWLKMMMIHIL